MEGCWWSCVATAGWLDVELREHVFQEPPSEVADDVLAVAEPGDVEGSPLTRPTEPP